LNRGPTESVERCKRAGRMSGRPRRVGLAVALALLVWGCQTTPEGHEGGSIQAQLTQQPKTSIAAAIDRRPATLLEPLRPTGTTPNRPTLLAPQKSPTPEPETTEIAARRVALLVPLTGRGAAIGHALLDAAQLALFEMAQDDLELLVFDTRGTVVGAEDAARSAVADGARLILGPLFGASALAVRPVVEAAGVSAVSFSNNRDVAGGGVYVFGFLPDQQVRRIISYAAGKGRVAIGALVPSSGFGKLVVATARIAAEQHGAAITRATYYDPNDPKLSSLIRHFADYDSRKSALSAQKTMLLQKTDQISRRALARLSGLETLGDPPFDSVLLPAGDPELRGLAPQLAFYDVDPARVQFLGTALWDEARGLGAEPAIVGGWYAAPSPKAWLLFEDKFERAFAKRPPKLASLGYDAMLLAVALTYGERGANYEPAALTDASGFAGVDGIFRLLTDGTNQRGLAVIEVEERGVRVIDPAPSSFAGLQF
jgi:branched-chain amino acid transport system substrate-binding protein